MPPKNDNHTENLAAHACGPSALRCSPERALRQPIRRIWALTAFLSLSGCAANKPPLASPCVLPVIVDVSAGDNVNPDESSASLPTVVRLVQLSHSVRAEESDFAQLWEQLDETLGDQLVQKRELTVFPGKVEHVPVELDPKTRYLLGMAVFRVPTGTQWRSIVPLPESEKLCAAYKEGAPSPALDFVLDGYRIEARSHLLKSGDRVDLPSDVTSGSDGNTKR